MIEAERRRWRLALERVGEAWAIETVVAAAEAAALPVIKAARID